MNKEEKLSSLDKEIEMQRKALEPFIVSGSTEPVTQETIEKRLWRIERAEELGIYLTEVNIESLEYQNPYKIKALEFIMQDQEVPEEIKEQIKQFEEKHRKDNENKLKAVQ